MQTDAQAWLHALPEPGAFDDDPSTWPIVFPQGPSRETYQRYERRRHPGLRLVPFAGYRLYHFLSAASIRSSDEIHGRVVVAELLKEVDPLFELASLSAIVETGFLSAWESQLKASEERRREAGLKALFTPERIQQMVDEAAGSDDLQRRVRTAYVKMDVQRLLSTGALVLWAGFHTFYPITLAWVEQEMDVGELMSIRQFLVQVAERAYALQQAMSETAPQGKAADDRLSANGQAAEVAEDQKDKLLSGSEVSGLPGEAPVMDPPSQPPSGSDGAT